MICVEIGRNLVSYFLIHPVRRGEIAPVDSPSVSMGFETKIAVSWEG